MTSASQKDDTWATLQYRTGWILLALVDAETDDWQTQLKHRLKRPVRSRQSELPEIGDVLEITGDVHLVILNFESEGERNRLATPAGQILNRTDVAGTLRPGALVEVLETSRDRVINGMQAVWARVGPAR